MFPNLADLFSEDPEKKAAAEAALAAYRESLSKMTRADATAALAELRTKVQAIHDGERSYTAALQAKALLELVTAGTARIAQLDTEDAEVQATFDSMTKALEVPEVKEPVQAPEAPKVEAPAVTEAPKVEAPQEAPVVAEEPVPVAASAPVFVPASRATAATTSTAPPQTLNGLTASVLIAADVPGFVSGQAVDGLGLDLAEAWRIRAAAAYGGSGTKLNVANVHLGFADDLMVPENASDAQFKTVLDHAGNPNRLPGGLTAAGWCAPSEVMLDLCPGSTTEGLYRLPEMAIRRGGIKSTEGADFSVLYAGEGVGWDFTEAELIAGAVKTCVDIPCPTFTEKRLDAVGFCITGEYLKDVGYPEVVASFIQEVQVAFQHRLAKKRLDAVLTKAGAALTFADFGTVATGVLNALEIIIEANRERYRWSQTEMLEVIAPSWLPGAIRADYAARNGVANPHEVPNQVVKNWFTLRGANPQFIYGWQQLAPGSLVYPETVQLLVYKAGTFVAGVAPVISLSAVHDSTMMAQNKYTAAFFEQGMTVVSRCQGAQLIEVPVCAAGQSGANDGAYCFAEVTGP